MNPSLSTVDSLLNVLPANPILLRNFNATNSRLNSIDLDQMAKARSSPSFNDSEPPSYFEVVGAGIGVGVGQGLETVPQSQTVPGSNRESRYSNVNVNFRHPSVQPNAHQRTTTTNSKEFTVIGII